MNFCEKFEKILWEISGKFVGNIAWNFRTIHEILIQNFFSF